MLASGFFCALLSCGALGNSLDAEGRLTWWQWLGWPMFTGPQALPEEDVVCPTLGGSVEERHADALEVLLSEELCPFVVAFFSSSSPLSQSTKLALTEQRLASSFPTLRYVRVETEQMSIRAFLQWDINYLPTYVLFWPANSTSPWQRWQSGKNANPYDYHDVSAWMTKATGLVPSNSSQAAAGPVPPRGKNASLSFGWFLVALAVLHRLANHASGASQVTT
ncbi:ACSL4 [Symbiodinium pilosum]|uniref:ACSL4 protein n=1 Tax=Symbiodinium pilosum TaxID=2952 RepID=A0A812P8Z9_SYMPI|nr:ACSL4 [Symbiodinium pilosum]